MPEIWVIMMWRQAEPCSTAGLNTCDFLVLGANIIDISTGEPHLPPYKVMERDGVKIVILGMITPATPCMALGEPVEGTAFRRHGGDCTQMDEDHP